MSSLNQRLHESNDYGNCLICGKPYSGKMVYMDVADRSEKRKVHFHCFKEKMEVDNTDILNSSKIRSNGIVNRVHVTITFNSDSIRDNFISYFVTGSWTYADGNEKRTIELISHKFSGMSSISKKLFNAKKKYNFTIKDFVIVNLNDDTSYNITMRNGDNKDYTEAVRRFNDKKFSKLDAWIEVHN